MSVFGQFTSRVASTTSSTSPCTISPYPITHSSYKTCRDSGESAHVPISCLPQAQQLILSNTSSPLNPIHIFSWLIILGFDDLVLTCFVCLFAFPVLPRKHITFPSKTQHKHCFLIKTSAIPQLLPLQPGGSPRFSEQPQLMAILIVIKGAS